jgi:excisionase family DNA binding protein
MRQREKLEKGAFSRNLDQYYLGLFQMDNGKDDVDDRVLIPILEAAERLSISRSKIYALMRSGRLRTVMIGGSRMVYMTEFIRLASEGDGVNKRGTVMVEKNRRKRRLVIPLPPLKNESAE